MRTRTLLTTAALLLAAARPTIAQSTAPALQLRGWSGGTRALSLSDLARMPRHEVVASAHNDSGRFSGVALSDLLTLVGAPRGDSLRGSGLASYVVVEAADGYRVVFALAELNPSYTDRLVLLVDAKDGKSLPAPEGPLRLVVPGEKRPARWVRQVTRVSLVRLPAGS